ncbi:MAG: hypothetical protein ACRC4G_01075 [Alphaproteobacteria bacterium]
MRFFLFNFRLLAFFLFSFVLVHFAEARVLDDKGNLLPQVFSIFHLLKPVLKPISGCPEACLESILSPQTHPQQVRLVDLALVAKNFLKRPEGVERWDSEFQQKFHRYHTKEMQDLFSQMGDLEKIEPISPQAIDYLVIFGGLVERVHKRISYLVSLYQKRKLHLSPQVQVVLLANNRPLNLFEISQLKLMKFHAGPLPKTEAQAIQWLWTNMKLPNGLRELGTHIAESTIPPLQHKKSTSSDPLQPAALNNLKKWFSSEPFPGHCLAISNQPFVYYHRLVIERFFQQQPPAMRQGWSFEMVGGAPRTEVAISVLLDNMARVLELEVQSLTEKSCQFKP